MRQVCVYSEIERALPVVINKQDEEEHWKTTSNIGGSSV